MRGRRPLPTDLADAARSGVPLGLLILAAAVPAARPIVLAALVAGFAMAVRRAAPVRWAWAAPIPVAVSLWWGLLPAPLADPLGGDCTDLDSPPAVWRAAEAGLALASLALLAYLLRARRSDLGLRWPARSVVRVAAAGALILGPIGLLLGALLARPFFGTFELDLSRPGFLLPALVFALANGVMEELSYRGALLGWTSRVTGTWLAVVGQAVVFGLAHGGTDVGGSADLPDVRARCRRPPGRRHRPADAVTPAANRLARGARPTALRISGLQDVIDLAVQGTTDDRRDIV